MIPAEFADLPFGEKLLLWAIRLWATDAREATNEQKTLRRGFNLAGVPDAYLALDGYLSLIAATATVQIDVRCSKCTEISNDEHLLLGVIAAWQQGHGKDHGTALLGTWLPQAAIRISQDPASKLASVLKRSGLFIRPRCWRQSDKMSDRRGTAMATQHRTLH